MKFHTVFIVLCGKICYNSTVLRYAVSKRKGNGLLTMQENFPAIEFDKVYFSYGSAEEKIPNALNGVSLKVQKGEFLAVLGHNGSGKSTLARLCDGLLKADGGKITVLGMDIDQGKNIYEVRKKVGIVFQNPDNQTVASIVEDDIAFGPENVGIPREEIKERIDFALSAVGMTEFRNAMPNRLSGGQKQRIAIAGVLALKPEIMILDESTAMLDPKGRKEVVEVVKRLNKEEGITVLLITHFPEEAMLADRAIVLNKGEIVMQGKPEELLKRGEELETFNLTLPRSVDICRRLCQRGVTVSDELTPEGLAEKIATFSNGKARGEREKKPQEKPQDKPPVKREEKGETGGVICENLSYTYNPSSPFASAALKGVSLEIKSGDFFGVIGHTGSGKSTFVQHLNALIKVPTAEKKYKPKKKKKDENPPIKLTVNGFDLTDKNTDFKALRKKVGMVFQYPEYQLFAETVFLDVAFGLKNFTDGLSEEEIELAVKEAIETVGLDYDEVKHKSPFELSGGQKRRVAIAGVIVTKPEILILDEPAAGLDPLGKKQVMDLLHTIHGDWCKTVIVVSHDMDEIAENCTGAAVFSEGKIVATGTPKELFSQTEKIHALSLDAPFTAKAQESLLAYGIEVRSDLTANDFIDKVVEAVLSSEEGGGEHA